MSCQFSSQYSGLYPIFSPDSLYVGSVSGSRISIKNVATLEQINIFQCVDKIEKIEFSPDSCYILCALFSRNAIQVFSLCDKEWKCRINEGTAGTRNVYWAPDSRHIISESDHGIQISIWSLLAENSIIIPLQKENYNQEGIHSKTNSFSDCGRFLAVVHRIEAQDQIGIYAFSSSLKQNNTAAVVLVAKFPSKSNDIANISWHQGYSNIITVDSPLSYCFCVYKPSGQLLIKYEAYSYALGIKSFAINKSLYSRNTKAGFIAIGSYDGKIRLLSMTTWELAFTLPLIHPNQMEKGYNCSSMLLTVELIGKNLAVVDNEYLATSNSKLLPVKLQQLKSNHFYRTDFLVPKNTVDNIAASNMRSKQLIYGIDNPSEKNSSFYALQILKDLPKEQSISMKNTNKSNTSASSSSINKYSTGGVKWIDWSSDGQYLAACEGKYPRCLWIWKPLKCKLIDLIIQLEPITCAKWRPCPVNYTLISRDEVLEEKGGSVNINTDTHEESKKSFEVLALCTGNNRIYFWTSITGSMWANITPCFSGGIENISSSTNIVACALQWSGDGDHLLIQGKEAHCICYTNFKDLFLQSKHT